MILISDKTFAKKSYLARTGKFLNLEIPKTFDDKLWYLKLNNRDPLLTLCSDKYKLREYVEQLGLGHILNDLNGVYDDAKNIAFSQFKEPFFLNRNHTSGANAIYDSNGNFDKTNFVKRFNFILKQNYYYASREWNYKNISSKIVAEKVLRDKNGNLPHDYKFLCFHGDPRLMYLSINTCTETGVHNSDNRYLNTYDMNISLTDIDEGYPIYRENYLQKPSSFEQMKKYAEILSKPFTHCRVDFYYGGGCNNIQPVEWDLKMGSWSDITTLKIRD